MSRARPVRPITAVSIAASDSGGGAGIQADLLTFAAHSVYGATVVVAGTAQNTHGVFSIESFSPRFVSRQIDAVFSDLAPAAVKIGMLWSAGTVRTVARGLRRFRAQNVVLESTGLRALRRDLLPLADLVTPNRDEAAALSGFGIRTERDVRRAARRIGELGARAVLVTGGDAPGDRVRDLLWNGRAFRTFEHRRIATGATHGSGCSLSAAVAANLARGDDLETSVSRAIRYVTRSIARGVFPGSGAGVPVRFPGSLTPRNRTGSRATSTRPPQSRTGRRRARPRDRDRGSSPSP
ncbi:MAG: bifunctional hydroxymethylpyrimidine kinase/phosphomethylpyrimidine kinase [Acidobacteria bacterium]|nr:MAG: bifunctional hydroxymethylpyrimidine kinase/phosphomethylpyrimidine kinase [Acidobacteriota bacterium]